MKIQKTSFNFKTAWVFGWVILIGLGFAETSCLAESSALKAQQKCQPGSPETALEAGRGFKSRLAEVLGCHSAYITQVFQDKGDFSLEQAEIIARWLKLNTDETHYFLLLIQFQRAGTTNLKKYFLTQIKSIVHEQSQVRRRFPNKLELKPEHQAQYYSHWIYSAVHMLVGIKKYQSLAAIQDFFKQSPDLVLRALNLLQESGIAIEKDGCWSLQENYLMIHADSPFMTQHHLNWRLKSLEYIQNKVSEDLHYTSIVSLSEQDLHQIKILLLETIEKYKAIVKPSPEEKLAVLCLDFFDLKFS